MEVEEVALLLFAVVAVVVDRQAWADRRKCYVDLAC